MPLIQIPSGTVHYRSAGDGPTPILFLHGFCQSSRFWAPTLARLAAGFSGYAPDLMGFGDSAKPDHACSVPGYADDAVAFADALGLDRFVLAGNSMGGVVCQSLATRHPGRLLKLVLVSTGASVPDPPAALAKADRMDRRDLDRAFFEAAVSGFFADPPAGTDDLVADAMKASRRAMVDSTRSSASLNLLDQLGAIAVPTLIVQGREDAGRTPEAGRQMRARIPGSRLYVIPGAGHTPMLERPEAFHRILFDFLGG